MTSQKTAQMPHDEEVTLVKLYPHPTHPNEVLFLSFNVPRSQAKKFKWPSQKEAEALLLNKNKTH